MNRTMKKWLAVLLAAAMLLALCACGGKTPEAPKDPAAVMALAEEKLAAAESISFDMDMQMALTANGETMDLGVTMQAETIKEPMTVHCLTHMGMFDLDTDVYLLQQDGAYITYTGVKDGEKTEWYKMTVDQEELEGQLNSYDADNYFSTQLDVAKDLKEVGTETVAGKQATRYDGVIPSSEIGEALAASGGAGDTLGLLGIDLSTLGQDIPISIWIYEDGLPAKYEFDMAELLTQLLSQSSDAAGITFTAMHISMTITDVDAVKEITLPAEALDAQELADEDLNGDTDEDVDLPWHSASLGETFTLTDGTELTVSEYVSTPEEHTIVVNAGLTDPDNAPQAALICSDDEGDHQLEEYTIDADGNYVFSTGDLEDPTVSAMIIVDGDPEDGEIWWVDLAITSES